MAKRETLTESMRRLSNIVNEAEQLNEDGPKEFVANRVASVLGPVATRVGKLARKFKPKRTPGLQNVTAGIIDDVISTVPIETAIKIDKMNRIGLSQDAQVKLMEIANSHLAKMVDGSSVGKEITQAQNDMKKLFKMSFDADANPKKISNLMLKVLRRYEDRLDLPPNFTRKLFREARDQYEEKMLAQEYAGHQFHVPILMMASYAAMIAAVASIINMEYNSPQNTAMRQGRQDQDFFGPDDDAPLSQGEQGYRDQDLLWNDDNEDPYKY